MEVTNSKKCHFIQSKSMNLLVLLNVSKKKDGIWLKILFQEITNKNVLIKVKVDNKDCIAIAEDENVKKKM